MHARPIEIFAFDFAPVGFAACQGQLMSIAQNQGCSAAAEAQAQQHAQNANEHSKTAHAKSTQQK